ncbi:endoplasmic reticulum resident protein 44 [Clonorchis sinensis]|uniref:Endoplasmic reticulum resident protein 44 n=1 Tax=Clonorchis sinensis TaxID=79923 RepID=G7YC66_CLOSI|nr:endoplasmic reticulum resident protein 44 [Clonorchis sinensis]
MKTNLFVVEWRRERLNFIAVRRFVYPSGLLGYTDGCPYSSYSVPFRFWFAKRVKGSRQTTLLLAHTCFADVFTIVAANRTALDNYKLVLIQYYATWCHFSRQLMPIFDEASNIFRDATSNGEVAFAQVNCEEAVDLCSDEKIRKYPTIKVLKYGITSKAEYRGQRTPEAFAEFVNNSLNSSVNVVHAPNTTAVNALKRIQDTREAIIGLFSTLDSSNPHLQHFLRASHVEKDRCSFHIIHGIVDEGDKMAHREAVSQRIKEITTMKKANFQAIHSWIVRKCTLLVRELTFANAEEITDEGLPLLLLFYDKESEHLKPKFHEVVNAHLSSHLGQINFLTADGNTFSHPLAHMGKSVADLPFFCIDSLVHMYAHPTKADVLLSDHNHLVEFITDLHSGKLHREFHYGPDKPVEESVKTKKQTPSYTFVSLHLLIGAPLCVFVTLVTVRNQTNQAVRDTELRVVKRYFNRLMFASIHSLDFGRPCLWVFFPFVQLDERVVHRTRFKLFRKQRQDQKTDPPESAFRKLGPSHMKYSILHDEF